MEKDKKGLKTSKKSKSGYYHNNFGGKKTVQKKNTLTVFAGCTIVVENVKTKERTEISGIRNSENPFFEKELFDVVTLKGEGYKIVRIFKVKPKDRKKSV